MVGFLSFAIPFLVALGFMLYWGLPRNKKGKNSPTLSDGCTIHKATAEVIVHFLCGSCGKWWSISEFGTKNYKTPMVCCPMCGTIGEVKPHDTQTTKGSSHAR